ncbi:MAG: GDSL-type esterase/lipase family protein, partial [Actinomycetes bacterium]
AGRVSAKTYASNPMAEIYSVAAPGETTASLSASWAAESQRRFSPDADNRLVIALSGSDCLAGISTSRSRLSLATILDECRSAGISTFVIGPTPSRTPELNRAIEHLASGFEDVCSRRGVPFVDFFRPLVEHEGFNIELKESVSGHPGQLGFGLMAWLVLNRGWFEWLGLEEVD